MANTNVQRGDVEEWTRAEWLPRRFNQAFAPKKLRLTPGGFCEFDAVSADGRIVVMISTGLAKTASGNGGAGKLNKLRSDMLFLTMLPGEHQRIVLLTAACMFKALVGEAQRGRVPTSIAILHADGMPADLGVRLLTSQQTASREVSVLPGRDV